MIAKIEREKPKLHALVEMNISERNEVEIKKLTDFDTYSAAKDPLPLLLDIIQTRLLAPTKDHLVDEDAAAQAYHTMKQKPSESKRMKMAVFLN